MVMMMVMMMSYLPGSGLFINVIKWFSEFWQFCGYFY